MNDLLRGIAHLRKDGPVVSPIMIVAPQLYPRACRELYKTLLRKIGIHHQYEYEGKTWWESNFVLQKKKPFKIQSVMRPDDGYYRTYSWFLPQAMKKRGYKVIDGKIAR